jgi:hypothetical protein
MTLSRSLLAAIDQAVLDPAVDDDDEVVDDLLDEWERTDATPVRRRRAHDEGGRS